MVLFMFLIGCRDKYFNRQRVFATHCRVSLWNRALVHMIRKNDNKCVKTVQKIIRPNAHDARIRSEFPDREMYSQSTCRFPVKIVS